ncbi:hypothetical protein TcCL_ESM04746 [Trypanosoma cruzi]|nr:hypothetical protein TcCL_ESM04746 [Trypanosoma cruzi]
MVHGVVVGRDNPVACRSIWGDCLSSGDGIFCGAAESTSFGGVAWPGSMLSATGTDAPRNPCSVDAGGTVLLHMLSPRHHTEPLEVGCRLWRISCTPPRGQGE